MNNLKNITQFMAGPEQAGHFLSEIKMWKRTLYTFIHENSSFKTRLSEVVDRETDKIFIAKAEQFQNDFILKDECILDIRNDIKGQEKDLQQSFIQKKEPDLKICKKQEKLRNEMSHLGKECGILKNHFDKYLLEC